MRVKAFDNTEDGKRGANVGCLWSWGEERSTIIEHQKIRKNETLGGADNTGDLVGQKCPRGKRSVNV